MIWGETELGVSGVGEGRAGRGSDDPTGAAQSSSHETQAVSPDSGFIPEVCEQKLEGVGSG